MGQARLPVFSHVPRRGIPGTRCFSKASQAAAASGTSRSNSSGAWFPFPLRRQQPYTSSIKAWTKGQEGGGIGIAGPAV